LLEAQKKLPDLVWSGRLAAALRRWREAQLSRPVVRLLAALVLLAREQNWAHGKHASQEVLLAPIVDRIIIQLLVEVKRR